MKATTRIAFRNLTEHKAKSLIVGLLMGIGALIFIIGNSLVDTSAQALKDTFIDAYTADVMVTAKALLPISLQGVTSTSMSGDEKTPIIPDFENTLADLKSKKEVASATPLISGFLMIDVILPEPEPDAEQETASFGEQSAFGFLYGIDSPSYSETFSAMIIDEGGLPDPGTENILLSKKIVDRLEKKTKIRIKAGDMIQLTGVSGRGMTMLNVKVSGIYHYKVETGAMTMFNYSDAQTARFLGGMVLASDKPVELTDEQQSFFDSGDDFSDFFSSSADQVPVTEDTSVVMDDTAPVKEEFDISQYTTAGSWNYILLRLNPGVNADIFIAGLNKEYLDAGKDLMAANWQAAAGGFAAYSIGLRIFINIVIIILFILVIFVIMNTLVISVIERTGEIGTMRALGAQKKTVRSILLKETFFISLIFGGAGIALGSLIIGITNLTGVPAIGVLEFLFGGKTFYPLLSIPSVIIAWFIVFVVGFLGCLYPIAVALRIQPIRAIQSE